MHCNLNWPCELVLWLGQQKSLDYHPDMIDALFDSNSNSNSTFIAHNLYLMIDSKTQKAKIRDRNR